MKNDTATLTTYSANETFEFGATFSQILMDEDIVALYGELGSGKTTLIQGICSGLQVQQIVTSPSFALIHEYQGRHPIFHFDFYRLESPEAIEQLDIDGYLNSRGISLIEWAERAEFFLPDNRFSIHIERTLENGAWTTERRVIRIRSPRSLEKLRSSIHACTGN